MSQDTRATGLHPAGEGSAATKAASPSGTQSKAGNVGQKPDGATLKPRLRASNIGE